MEYRLLFGDVLDAAERLSLEDQQALAYILHFRVVEQRRKNIFAEVREAQSEFQEGRCEAVSVDALMDEILS